MVTATQVADSRAEDELLEAESRAAKVRGHYHEYLRAENLQVESLLDLGAQLGMTPADVDADVREKIDAANFKKLKAEHEALVAEFHSLVEAEQAIGKQLNEAAQKRANAWNQASRISDKTHTLRRRVLNSKLFTIDGETIVDKHGLLRDV